MKSLLIKCVIGWACFFIVGVVIVATLHINSTIICGSIGFMMGVMGVMCGLWWEIITNQEI